jgi:hypothetical protein
MQYKTFTLQKYLNSALPALLFFVCVQFLPAQRRFSAEGVVGMTASQIDGDASAGFHKVGVQGGIGVSTRLKGKQSASIQMLFTQRGCQNQPQIFPYFKTTLNYVEVPIQWHYADWLVEGEGRDDDWYRARFSAGLSYARLISYKDKFGYGIEAALPDLNSNSFCLVVGASIFTSRHLGFTFRYNRSLAPLYSPGSGKNFPNTLFERFLSIQLNYRL